jgi:hypothetical protein
MLMASEVLKMLKEGKTVKEISKISGAKIASVKAHKKRLIQKQLWQDKEAGLQWTLDLDQVTDFLIDRLEKAKLVTELEAKINRLENQLAATKNELEILQENHNKKIDKEQRYKLAIQQGDINPPISSRK